LERLRLFALVLAVSIATGLCFATVSVAQPRSTSDSNLSSEPPLPANVVSRHRFVAGVKCDFPPFGYLTSSGEHAGFEIDVVREFAKLAFGSKDAVTLTCVTGTNRFAYLESGRVDFLMATVAYLASRAEIVDFSNPYFESGGVLLVPKNSPIKGLTDIQNRPVAGFQGDSNDQWLKRCMPAGTFNPVYVSDVNQQLEALESGRAVAIDEDAALLSYLVYKSPMKYRLVGPEFGITTWGVAVKKGNTRMLSWLNAALARLVETNTLTALFEKDVPGPEKIGIALSRFLATKSSPLQNPTNEEYLSCKNARALN
jgi:polar amino acid transport system substrate-binding protein